MGFKGIVHLHSAIISRTFIVDKGYGCIGIKIQIPLKVELYYSRAYPYKTL